MESSRKRRVRAGACADNRALLTWVIVAAALAQAVSLEGCASDQANRYYGHQLYPPRPVDSVELLAAPPDRPYRVIADFQSRGESPRDMQRKAAKIGADAVVVVTVGGYRLRSDEWAGEDTHRSSYSRILGTALMYTEVAK